MSNTGFSSKPHLHAAFLYLLFHLRSHGLCILVVEVTVKQDMCKWLEASVFGSRMLWVLASSLDSEVDVCYRSRHMLQGWPVHNASVILVAGWCATDVYDRQSLDLVLLGLFHSIWWEYRLCTTQLSKNVVPKKCGKSAFFPRSMFHVHPDR